MSTNPQQESAPQQPGAVNDALREVRDYGNRIDPSVALWSQRVLETMLRNPDLYPVAYPAALRNPQSFCRCVAGWIPVVDRDAIPEIDQAYRNATTSYSEFMAWTRTIVDIIGPELFFYDGMDGMDQPFPGYAPPASSEAPGGSACAVEALPEREASDQVVDEAYWPNVQEWLSSDRSAPRPRVSCFCGLELVVEEGGLQVDNGEREPSTILACGHMFGEHCIRVWKERSPVCPACHAPIS
ncbi:ERAD-associated E3 ubiquitin-protein ligase HRD1 [Cytospora mali]|uniref:ERAD-associated E3 ubiquitin-protein ligase HRD1 n=1 Tax=Cytospora mali TaxID=578113 RepID=A0A194V6M5_CYTMA|nr:ERAD-associated E3 ubiquitin-protein ligase HRD1 [Valsa mali var. pyri (nom. inval.)]